ITLTGTPPRVAVSVSEFRGIAATNPDRTASNSGTSSAPASGSTSATTRANELVIGAIGAATASATLASFTVGAGFTALPSATTISNANSASINPEYQIVTTSGTYAANGTLSSTQDWAADIATYIASPTVSSVSPNAGNANNTTSVIITGSNLSSSAAVSFGG